MRSLLLSFLLAGSAQAATYQAEVDATPKVRPGGVVHVVMSLRWLEESLPTAPAFCVTTPAGWRPEGAVGALRSRRGTPVAKPLTLGGLPGDQLDAARSGEGWACVVGTGRRWRQGASGTVVFTLRAPSDASGAVELRTAVGRTDRSVHVGEITTVHVTPSAPEHSSLETDPLLARRVFNALDSLDVLELEAQSLAGQLSLRQPPPIEQRVGLAEQVAAREAATLAELAAPVERELPGYTATFNAEKDEATASVRSASHAWLSRTCSHKERLLAEPENDAHRLRLEELESELSGLAPALAPWWTPAHVAEVERCTALTRADMAHAAPHEPALPPEPLSPP